MPPVKLRVAAVQAALLIATALSAQIHPALARQEPDKQPQAGGRQAAAPDFPPTPLGRLAREWLDVVNGGDETTIRRFVEGGFSPNALRLRAAEKYVRLFAKLRQQSGGLEVLRVTPPTPSAPMFILARSRRGDRHVRISMGFDEATGKLAGMGFDRVESPESQGRNAWPERVAGEAEMISAVKAYVERRAAADLFSGVVLVAKDDRILLQVAHGLADQTSKTPNRPNTTFHLASVGKMFTSAAVARLVRDGKLSYDDTVAKLLPDYPNQEVARKITVHHLLTHTSGLGTFFNSPGYDAKRRYRDACDEFTAFKDEPLFFEPGAGYRYSNAGYSVLGAIIERASGKKYLAYLYENIFAPLGMNDTDVNTPERIAPNTSVLYTQSPDDPLGADPFMPDLSFSSSRPTGFGDGHSNAADLFKFARAIRTGRLLGEEATRLHVTGKVSGAGPAGQLYGYGFTERTVNGEVVRGHSGGGRTDVQMLWGSGYIVIVQTNRLPPPATALANEITNFITKQLAAAPGAKG